MAFHTGFWVVFYLIDALTWLFAYWLIPTRFFGIPAKESKSRGRVFAAAAAGSVLVCALLQALFYGRLLENGVTPEQSEGFIATLCLIYWMFYLREPGRFKRFIILVAADTLTGTFMVMANGFLNAVRTPDGEWTLFLQVCLRELIALGAIGLAVWFSSRHRKEPMRFFHILSLWFFCELLSAILRMFEVGQIRHSIIQIDVRYAFSESRSAALLYGMTLMFTVALALFLIMIVRESESEYFRRKNAISEYYLETQKNHYADLTESNREIRRIRHDMKNHIYCMRELCQNRKYEELESYLRQVDEGLAHAEQRVMVGNEIADAILSEKCRRAEEKQISLLIDGTMFKTDMRAVDICTIFANLLDNAIEAVEELPEGQRRISLSLRKNRNYFLIEEENKTKRKAEVKNGNEIATTKRDKGSHGFGILNIREAAAAYDGDCAVHVSDSPDENGLYDFRIELLLPLGREEENK